jgi:hypothetical protein
VSSGTVKVGRVDDPIWDEPISAPTQRPRLRDPLRTIILVGAAVLIVGACVTWFVWPRQPGGGDPGAHILSQLRPVSRAVPPNAKIEYAHYNEPRWDSCDGIAGTFGWDDPSAQIEFTWTGSPTALIGYAEAALAPSGWGAYTPEVSNGLPGAGWTKRLNNGTTARAQLGANSYGRWFMFADAAPLGRRASC